MKPVSSFHVRPLLPERLAALEELAFNIRWSWDHETIALFRRLDRDLWETTNHNPVRMLGLLSQERLKEAAEDEAFLAHMDRVQRDLLEYTEGASTWYRKSHGRAETPVIAYFSMEFGLTESLPGYSGGLGVLAGDHLKSASELDLPLVGVGILYQKGYFRQYLTAEGWQHERYPVNDFFTMPVRLFRRENGEPVKITVELAGRPAAVQLWWVQVGRVRLVLLDTNVPENSQDLQDVTDELYGGDGEIRIQQEIVLGIGGVRALGELGIAPKVFHLNEGHCTFLVLERARRLMKAEGLSFPEAMEVVRESTVFTTHTPVPAGIDLFPPDLVERYFASFRAELGLTADDLVDLGRPDPGDRSQPLNMAVLALRASSFVNGVSRLHARVARRMWKGIWPGVPEDEIPITHITNGIHPGSWISDDLRTLYDRYLGPNWLEEPSDTGVWKHAEQIPGEELWRTHERRRERLVAFARRRLSEQLRARGTNDADVADAENVLDPEALTIGFARRFAAYKRGTLLLTDPVRLARILGSAERPVQIIYAGKAHPRDEAGKALIREIVQLARRPEFRRRVVFLEDYDAVVARYLVQGVDVWLNTPRRPLEACGTSGMKAAMNAALNLSTLDGWWDEAYAPGIGWRVGAGETYQDPGYQDRLEAASLYDLLEQEIVPLFYHRSTGGMPLEWIRHMKSAMAELCPRFNTNRMVQEYTVSAYHPALSRLERLEAERFRLARELAAWRARVESGWSRVAVAAVDVEVPTEVRVGCTLAVSARIRPGSLHPEDLSVQAYLGRVDDHQEIVGGEVVSMAPAGPAGDGTFTFQGRIECRRSGLLGVTVRVLPIHPALADPLSAHRILWAE
jgi:starch phosphorylase